MSSQPRPKLLEVEQVGEVTVVRFTCQTIMGHDMVHGIAEQLLALIEKSERPQLLLNFRGVDFITSSMLGKLLMLRNKTESAGGQLAHRLAVEALRAGPGEFPVGLTLSMAEITADEGGEALRDAAEEMLENVDQDDRVEGALGLVCDHVQLADGDVR